MNQLRPNKQFVDHLSQKALNSSAVKHPYLESLRTGSFPNMVLALQDFAFQYRFYSCGFVEYLKEVIEQLPSDTHKSLLLENLAEENGDTHGVELPQEVLETIEGVAHCQLYKRFQEAIGVDQSYIENHRASETALMWREQFMHLCKLGPEVGIGALGMGTELIVFDIYDQILDGIKQHTSLSMIERVFFDLHSQCDEEHAAQMQRIAEDLAHSTEAQEKIEFGTKMAINLRTLFWDKMHERALAMPKENIELESLSCV